jgi:DNA-binding transcriptional LysR family regulator
MAKIIDWDDHIGRRLRLRDLRVFFAVVQWGSMAKAAAQFRVSQPAVSQVIADLEHALAVKLLDRRSRGVEPTIYGRALLVRARAAFDELRQGIRDIEFLADPTSGELQIGCSEAFSATIVPPIIHRFSQAYPRVIVQVNDVPPTHEQLALHDRKNDLILGRWVRPVNFRADDLNVETLFNDHLVVAAGMHSRWARRRKIDLAELVEEPWVLGPPGNWIYSGTEEAFRARGLDMPKVTLLTYSVPLRSYALANGPYIATFPKSVALLNAERYSLKVLPIDLPVASRPVVIMTLKNRSLSPLVERFIECAREEAKSIGRRTQARTARAALI